MKALLIKAVVATIFAGIMVWINDGTPMDFAIVYMLFLLLMRAERRDSSGSGGRKS